MKFRWITRVALLTLIAAGLTACNTFEGIGKDLQSVGRTISESSD